MERAVPRPGRSTSPSRRCAAAVLAALAAWLPGAGPAAAQPSSRGRLRWERFWQRPQSISKYHASVKKAFAPLVADARKSTVGVYCGGKRVSLGTVVDAAGYVATKASELDGAVECRLPDGSRRKAEIVATDRTTDLALLKVEGGNLTAVAWADRPAPAVGSWIVTPGPGSEPVSLGVVSVAERLLAPPRRAAPTYGFLGISFDTSRSEPFIERVYPSTGAARAGLRAGDVILQADGKKVADRRELQNRLRKAKPGDKIRLHIQRGSGHRDITATLGRWLTGRQLNPQEHMGGELSRRSSGFGRVVQHDSALRPNQCGGPAVDSSGKAVGINIARAGRVESYLLPAGKVREVVARLKRAAERKAADEKAAEDQRPPASQPAKK